jgi:hypothetical protein
MLMLCQRNETVAPVNLQNRQNKFHRIIFGKRRNVPTNSSVLGEK